MKLVLLCSILIRGSSWAETLISSDRFLLKVIDQTISLEDFQYQARNFKALKCIYDDALVVQYFEKSFIDDWNLFLNKFPDGDEAVRVYMQKNTELLKKIRQFFKILRYSEDQKMIITADLIKIIRKQVKESKCDSSILYKDTLKTNFISLLRMELYFRSRYAAQLKNSTLSFNTVRPSIDLFVESLDKQFTHEYFW